MLGPTLYGMMFNAFREGDDGTATAALMGGDSTGDLTGKIKIKTEYMPIYRDLYRTHEADIEIIIAHLIRHE